MWIPNLNMVGSCLLSRSRNVLKYPKRPTHQAVDVRLIPKARAHMILCIPIYLGENLTILGESLTILNLQKT